MIRNRHCYLDVSVQKLHTLEIDASAATSNIIYHLDTQRDIIVQRVDAYVVEGAAATHLVNVGYAASSGVSADPDAYVDASGLGTSNAATAGLVINLTTTPFRVPAGYPLTIGHEQVSGAGIFRIALQYVNEDGSSTRAKNA